MTGGNASRRVVPVPRFMPRKVAELLFWLLACTLLLMPTLGLMHEVVHGPQAHRAVHALAHDAHHSHDAHEDDPWLGRLFSTHKDDNDCRLFDQASHGSAASLVAVLSLPMVFASQVFDISRGEALARWAALFDARGPPLAR